jgi:hypothetical protein
MQDMLPGTFFNGDCSQQSLIDQLPQVAPAADVYAAFD